MEAVQDHQNITLGKNLDRGTFSKPGAAQHSDQPLEVLHSYGSGFAGISIWAQLAVELRVIDDEEELVLQEAALPGWAVPDGGGKPRGPNGQRSQNQNQNQNQT